MSPPLPPVLKAFKQYSQDERDSAIALLHLSSGVFSDDQEHTRGAYNLLDIHHSSQDSIEYTQNLESTAEAHTPSTTSDSSSGFDRDSSIFSQASSASTAPSDYLAAMSKEELRKKKKAINQNKRRRAKRQGTYEGESGERLRESMKGKEYTKEEDDFIRRCYLDYKRSNHGRDMPLKELLEAYNNRFSEQKRTESGLSTHIGRSKELSALRNGIIEGTKSSTEKSTTKKSSGTKSASKKSSGTKSLQRRPKGKSAN
ncbi:hypothetical protein PRZ48_004471 [Zasmidium cellare]|uniref:Uncharacterized protein n=1 Tax=Zasmidium cellare TaxID=395010 RepID=A0ABR0ER17_ZASCE|nr:hypothetical protein PRZ48_004471 [Zasmidium cellare]